MKSSNVQDKLNLPVDDFAKSDIFARIALVCSAITVVLGVLGMIGWLRGFSMFSIQGKDSARCLHWF